MLRLLRIQPSHFPTRAPALVSSTPPEFQVEIANGYLEDNSPDLDHPADIIGFSLMTPRTLRAYRIVYKFQ